MEDPVEARSTPTSPPDVETIPEIVEIEAVIEPAIVLLMSVNDPAAETLKTVIGLGPVIDQVIGKSSPRIHGFPPAPQVK